MRRTMTIFFAVLLTATAALPLAAAGWKFRGINEPDTSYDDGYVFDGPDQTGSTEQRVYFSGFQHSGQLWVNPNVGALGSRMQQYGSTQHSVLLGVWKDCNKDGYIGLGEASTMEYRAELLLDRSICPEQKVTDTTNPPSPYPYNDGAWIREFNWIGAWASTAIGPKDNPKYVNPTFHIVEGTQVWFDWGTPNARPGTSCPISGGFSVRTVGAFLDYADCFTNYQTVEMLNNIQDNTGLPVGGWDTEDLENSPDAALNLEFPLWDELYGPDGNGFGSDGGLVARDDADSNDRARRAVTVWDCSNNDAPALDPQGTPDTSGSVYEPANETYNVATKGKCKTSGNDNELPYFNLGSNTEGTDANSGKSEVSDQFIWAPGSRRHIQQGGGPLGPFAPADGGLALERNLDTLGPSWRSNTGWTTGPMLVNRDGLEPTGAGYMTYYAKLGDPTAFALPGSGPYTYGPEACATVTGLDPVSRWWCDEQKWLDTCSKQGADTRTCITVGATYHLRDVDCWDNRVMAGQEIYLSLAPLSTTGVCSGGPQNGLDP